MNSENEKSLSKDPLLFDETLPPPRPPMAGMPARKESASKQGSRTRKTVSTTFTLTPALPPIWKIEG